MTTLPAEILTLEGPDAVAFAHAQLASDVRALDTGTWQWSAWLDPQGRVRALLQLMRPQEEQLVALLRGGTAAAMAAALAPYVMRRQVNLTAQAPGALQDALPCATGTLQHEDNDMILGLGDYAMRITPDSARTAQAWRLQAILAGHPWLPDSALGTLLAPSLSLPELGATNLDKGCFPGQEIVARLHYRGGCKQHLRRITSDIRPWPGSTLSVDDTNVGMILDSAPAVDGNYQALAVMRDTVAGGKASARLGSHPEKCIFINAIN